ncbi:MAG: pyridoxal phosphate-dependent aminotransferase [Polyangiaceae bacterium]
MSRRTAERLSAVAPSATLAISARAAELRAKGVDVFAFGVGEPDFEPPGFVLEAAREAILKGASKYTAVTGLPELKEAIRDSILQRRGYACETQEICVSVGAKHALFNLAIALYEPGDEVIIPAPYWVSYPEQVRMFGAKPVIVETEEANGFRVTPEALEAAITPKTKAFILCSPSNPTGSAYDAESMGRLLDVMGKHDAWFVIDEIYADLVYDGFKHGSPRALRPDLTDRIIVVDGVSKSYAMTGWRIGWTIAPKALTKTLDLVQGQSTTNAATIAQRAAISALRGPQDTLLEMRAKFESRRNRMVQGLNDIPGIRCRMPEGAFYAFADVRDLVGKRHAPSGKLIESDDDLARVFLDHAHVACVPGSGFGAAGYMRFSYASNEERIDAGLASLRRTIAEFS